MADLTCGDNGSTGSEVIARINENTQKADDNASAIDGLEDAVTNLNDRTVVIEENFPAEGNLLLTTEEPNIDMQMVGDSGEVVALNIKTAAQTVASIIYNRTAEFFGLMLNSKVDGNILTSLVLNDSGTCQINGAKVLTTDDVYYEYYKKPAAQSVEQDTYIEIGRLDLTNVPIGTYSYSLGTTYRYDTTGRSAMFRFSIDGGTNWTYWQKEIKDTTNDELFHHSFPKERTTVENLSLIVEAKCENASDTLEVKYLNIVAEKKK